MAGLLGESLRSQIFFIIKEHPGLVRTEIPPMVSKAINVVTPAIKELIDMGMVVEGPERLSKVTNKSGKMLYAAEEWAREVDSQNRIFE